MMYQANLTRGFHPGRTLCLALLLVTLSMFALIIQPDPAAAQSPIAEEDALVWGYIIDKGTPSDGTPVKVTRALYIGNGTVTDENGMYTIRLPSGDGYTLTITNAMGRTLIVQEFNVSKSQALRLDFLFNSSDIAHSHLYGKVLERLTRMPIEGMIITLTREGETVPAYKAETDGEGRYDLLVPAGRYILSATVEGHKVHEETIALDWDTETQKDLKVTSPSREVTLDNFVEVLNEKWYFIILIIITVIIGLVLLFFVARAFDDLQGRLTEHHTRFVSEEAITFIDRFTKAVIVVIMAIIIIYLSAKVFMIESLIWDPIANAIYSLVIIAVLIVFLRISLMILSQFVSRTKARAVTEKKPGSTKLFLMVEMIGKYLLILSFGFIIALIALSALGLNEELNKGLVAGLWGYSQHIIFIVIVLVTGIIILKFFKAFLDDWNIKQTKFQPEMIGIATKGMNIFVMAMVGMIILFTLLSAIGLGQVGQTVIIVVSMIVGLVVSMAATGSIGNILSGLVLLAFKPFSDGDVVRIGEKYIGYLMHIDLMFTKIKDFEDRVILIPNNFVLTAGIVNWTRAAQERAFAVEIDCTIGYNVPINKTIRLLERGAKMHKGVRLKPAPYAVATAFMDHAIAYKLRAFIKTPSKMYTSKSEIMANIQEAFADEGEEIMSPLQYSRREAKSPTREETKAFHDTVVAAKGHDTQAKDTKGA